MKFLGKMYFEIILKATKNQGFILSLEDTLGLSWSEECIIVTGTVDNQIPTFAITDKELFVPVVILSAQDNAKLLQQLKASFKYQLSGININQMQNYRRKTDI